MQGQQILIPLAALYFAVQSNIPQRIKWLINKRLKRVGWELNRLKPLDCTGCLSFWLSIAYHVHHKYNTADVILYSLALACIGVTLERLYERIAV